jgi:hypothetical protein
MTVLTPFRRRWPELALAAGLVLAAVFSGLALRSLAIALTGVVLLFALRRRVRDAGLGIALTVVLLATVAAATFTVDLGAVFGGVIKDVAEREGTRYLERPMHIGRLGIRLARGQFVVEDLRIEGVRPGDAPFFTARRILVDLPWFRVFRTREFLVLSIEMNDWTMQIEKFQNGDNLPRLTRQSKEPAGPRRFTTTLQYVHAYRGRFAYIDRGAWQTIARNLDIYVRHDTGEYLGTATITDGMVQIKDSLPMRSDMRIAFKVEPTGLVRLPRIVLDTDGSHSLVTGQVDFGHWPEMIYYVDSEVDLWRMREIFFTRESWRSRGDATFKGTFRLFRGGHELKGDFTSALAHVNAFAFPDLRGSLIWVPHRFEVTHATAGFYGGVARFRYEIAPLSDPRPAVARWQVAYEHVDLAQFSSAVDMRGVRLLGTADGRNLLEWPLGRFSEHAGDGTVVVTPPAGHDVLTRTRGPSEAAIDAEPPEIGPEPDVNRYPRPTPVGGEFIYRFGPEWLEVAPSHLATQRTYVEFQGRTAYGAQSEFPFYARSADWQESDRLLAGIITAFGSPTGIIRVGGHGEFRGTMTKAFRDPRIEGDFVGDRIRAWDVEWGHATGHLAIENAYVDISHGVVTQDDSEIQAEGRFSLGYPRKDGGEEIYARFKIRDRRLRDLRHAFQLDDWPLDGQVSGDFRLSERYTRPLGYGTLAITHAVAWGEPFDSAAGQMRFVGDGVRLDAAEIRKSGGLITGAAFVGWDGRYSFNADGQRIPLASIAAIRNPRAPWSGLVRFSAQGAATFASPRYDASMSSDDLAVGDNAVGAVLLRMVVRERLVTIEQFEAASLGVSGSGQIEMSAFLDSELSLRFTKTLLDPYVRLFEPALSPYVRASMSGVIRAVGQLANLDRLLVTCTVESLNVRLFDYDLHNDGPINVALDDDVIKVLSPLGGAAPADQEPRIQITGEGTRLELSGGADLRQSRIGVKVAGTANLGILQLFSKEIRSSGQAELNGEVSGPFSRPQFAGSAKITDGRFRHLSLPQSLSAINGRVSFTGDAVRLEDISAQLAGGRVRFGGRVEMNGLTPGQFSLTFSGDKMAFDYPEGFRSIIDAQLDLVGTPAAPLLRGSVVVRSGLYTKQIDFTPDLFKLLGGRPAAPMGGPAPSLPLRFDLTIQAPSALRVESKPLRALASADLTLRGTYDHPMLLGHAEIERGEALFEGKRYTVTHGSIDFNNPTKIEPFFDIAAETLVRAPGQTYNIDVQLVGTVNRFEPPQLTADPPLPPVEIVALLFGGESSSTTVQNPEVASLQREAIQGTLATSRVQQAAVGAVAAPVTRAVEEAFGLSTFQITPNLYDPNQRVNPTARLTVGKRISDRVYFTFSRSLNSPGNGDQVMLLEYDQNNRLSWVFSRNEDGTYALDVRKRHVF